MDYAVIIFSGVVFIGIMVYFFKTYQNKRMTPEKFSELKSEMKEVLVKNGAKKQYEAMGNDQLRNEYMELKGKKVKRSHIIKMGEAAARLELILDVFKKRGVRPF